MKKFVAMLAALTFISSSALSVTPSTVFAEETVSAVEVQEDTKELFDLEASHMKITEGDFEFNVYDDFAALINYNGTSDTEVVIPEEVKNVPVKVITGTVFGYCRKLTTITLPSTVQMVAFGNDYL